MAFSYVCFNILSLSNPPYILMILFLKLESKRKLDPMTLIRMIYRSMSNLLVVTPLKKMSSCPGND